MFTTGSNGKKFGDHPSVQQFIKGVFNIHPPQPRYSCVCDIDLVISLLKRKQWYPAWKLSLLQLTQKVFMLILIITAQRGQGIRALNVDNMFVSSSSFRFKIRNEDLKQGPPGYKPEVLKLAAFSPDKRLCIANYLKVYLECPLDNRCRVKELILTTKNILRQLADKSGRYRYHTV